MPTASTTPSPRPISAHRKYIICLRCFANDRRFLPYLIKGDLDSIRDDVRAYYTSQGVPIIGDKDQDSTDLMKCVEAITEKELHDGVQVLPAVLPISTVLISQGSSSAILFSWAVFQAASIRPSTRSRTCTSSVRLVHACSR